MSDNERVRFGAMKWQDIREEFISVAEMQRRIMPDPERSTVFGDFDIFGNTLPTAIVGGDFYSFIDLDGRFGIDGKMGIVIADAAGHGLAAAMLIRDFNTALYTAIAFQSFYVQDTTPLLFTRINRRIYRSSEPNQFIASFYSELQLDGTIRYINAGHPSPRLFKSDGTVRQLDVGGPVLGVFPDPPEEYRVGEAVIENGEILICCTDGIIEATDPAGREYGFARMEEVVRSHRDRGSHTIFAAILKDVETFSRDIGQTDDRTLIVVRKGRGNEVNQELAAHL